MSRFLSFHEENAATVVALQGAWTVVNSRTLQDVLQTAATAADRGAVTFDLAAVDQLDSSGAWLIQSAANRLRTDGVEVTLRAVPEQSQALFERVGALDATTVIVGRRAPREPGWIERLGRGTVDACNTSGAFVTFIGHWFVVSIKTLLNPGRFRLTSAVAHLEKVGLDAMPIVGLIAFLIGVVLAYQGAIQLRMFGAEIYTIDLIAVSVLRELGILLTAIVLAGRTASAYTAQIGSMQVNEEVDALRTIGVEPMEVLVGPRVLAMVIALPILALFANFMGLLGGGVMAWAILDIPPVVYLQRLREAVTVDSFWVGMIKAPVFGLVISLVGCFEGLQVTNSAESVGRHTTRAVVEAIFMVIVLDALFSIVFGLMGI